MDTEQMLQAGGENAIRRLMHKNAVDMQTVSQAVWKNSGGIEGWVEELDALKKRAITEGDNGTVFKVLKMNIDLTEKAQAAGQMATDEMSDAELKAVIKGHVEEMAASNPGMIKDIIEATATPVQTHIPDYEFMQ